MQNALLHKFVEKNRRTDAPVFRPGDTIKVHVKIKEGDKERLQVFEGTCWPVRIQAWARRSRSAK